MKIIKEAIELSTINQLSQLLNLYEQTRIMLKLAHWNTTGINFLGIHELYDDVASSFLSYSDTIAERIRLSSDVSVYIEQFNLPEDRQSYLSFIIDHLHMVSNTINLITKNFDDPFISVLQEHELEIDKYIYLLTSTEG